MVLHQYLHEGSKLNHKKKKNLKSAQICAQHFPNTKELQLLFNRLVKVVGQHLSVTSYNFYSILRGGIKIKRIFVQFYPSRGSKLKLLKYVLQKGQILSDNHLIKLPLPNPYKGQHLPETFHQQLLWVSQLRRFDTHSIPHHNYGLVTNPYQIRLKSFLKVRTLNIERMLLMSSFRG